MLGYGARWAYIHDRTSEDDLEYAKTFTHDSLIADLGHRRRSGVSWFVWTPAEATMAMLRAGSTIPTGIAAEMRAHPNGLVVLAVAEAVG